MLIENQAMNQWTVSVWHRETLCLVYSGRTRQASPEPRSTPRPQLQDKPHTDCGPSPNIAVLPGLVMYHINGISNDPTPLTLLKHSSSLWTHMVTVEPVGTDVLTSFRLNESKLLQPDANIWWRSWNQKTGGCDSSRVIDQGVIWWGLLSTSPTSR